MSSSGAPEPLAERRERAGRGEQRRQGRQVRDALAAAFPARAAGAVGRRRPARASAAAPRRPSRVLDLGVDRGDVEVDLRPRASGGAWRAANSVGDAFGDPAVAAAPAAHRRRRARLRRPAPAGRIRRQPVRVRRIAVGVGRAVDLAGRGQPGRVRRSELEHVEAVGGLVRALARPGLDRVGGGVEQLVEPLLLVGREAGQDVVDRVAVRLADPDPQPAELLGARARR